MVMKNNVFDLLPVLGAMKTPWGTFVVEHQDAV